MSTTEEKNAIVQKPSVVRTAEQREVRQERKRKRGGSPFGVPRTKLSLPVQPPEGEVWKWINDTPGELAAAQAGDWEFVTPAEIGEGEKGDTVSRYVGTDDQHKPLHGFLMKIPKDWYEEDEKQRLELPNKINEQIKKGMIGKDGLRSTTGADMSYVPKVGIKMEETSS